MATDRSTDTFATITPAGPLPKVTSIFDFSAEALASLRLWLEQNPPAVPITSILGFTQFLANVATVGTLESTSSTSYTDLATVGPSITGLPDGKYVIVVTAAAEGSAAGVDAWMSYSVNGAAASDSTGSRASNTAIAGLSMFSTMTLSAGGNNSIVAKYRTSSGTASFTNRCLFALRYANK